MESNGNVNREKITRLEDDVKEIKDDIKAIRDDNRKDHAKVYLRLEEMTAKMRDLKWTIYVILAVSAALGLHPDNIVFNLIKGLF